MAFTLLAHNAAALLPGHAERARRQRAYLATSSRDCQLCDRELRINVRIQTSRHHSQQEPADLRNTPWMPSGSSVCNVRTVHRMPCESVDTFVPRLTGQILDQMFPPHLALFSLCQEWAAGGVRRGYIVEPARWFDQQHQDEAMRIEENDEKEGDRRSAPLPRLRLVLPTVFYCSPCSKRLSDRSAAAEVIRRICSGLAPIARTMMINVCGQR
eukprot:887184-Rhodomonas_salina.2